MTQSSELAGGDGFTYEGCVAAFYMASLLAEAHAPGLVDRVVHQVAVQQRDFGEPLDDVIVDFRAYNGEIARLSLQVKRTLKISKAVSNSDFRDIIRDSWSTLTKPDFREGVDRYGAAVGTVSAAKARALSTLGELARESPTPAHFGARFETGGNAPPAVKVVKEAIATLLAEVAGSSYTDVELHRFLAHFVLVQFDFLHEGATDPPTAITRIRDCLEHADAEKAPLVWSRLVQLARTSAGKSGVYDRSRLVRSTSQVARLRGAASLRADLNVLRNLAQSYAESIQDDVGGTRLDRTNLTALLEKKLTSRVIQIRGLPGSGKSVLLRQRVQRAIKDGSVLFLKGDQLEGQSWRTFATANGLSTAPLTDLLVEIAATGTPILFLDAIDRIENEHQPIVLDVLRAVTQSPSLDNWRIVMSLRDTGVEPTRSWMGGLFDSVGIETVEVGPLDDDEADALANQKPHLRSLLFGTPQVREIVRRPFFAKILQQSHGAIGGDIVTPHSEIDLIDNWWRRGGYNAAGQGAIERQRAIIELGRLRARNLSQPISLGKLSQGCIGRISQFIEDGILQSVRPGLTVRFSHDIFFEWAFFHVLADSGDKWLGEIRDCGQPPAIARIVELLSQREYAEKHNWADQLAITASSQMRSQWTRAWLLGPVSAPTFARDEELFANAIFANDFHFLKKALVWLQAEKTTPNPGILAQDLPRETQLRYADILSWPSDFAAWRRFISFLLRHIPQMPASLYRDVLSVFEVWQNALAGIRNSESRKILTQCSAWLDELDTSNPPPKKWESAEGLRELRSALVGVVLIASPSEPSFAEHYLKRIIGAKRIPENEFREIVSYAQAISRTQPALLVDVTLHYLKMELPDDLVKRERAEAAKAAETRRRILAKPEHERTEGEKRAISANSFSWARHHQFSFHDWDTLSIDRDFRSFYPPSPLREPFHSLFKSSPTEAIRLLRELCNHAMTAWRQLHRHAPNSHGTPVPLELNLPWGVQIFWGGDREYLWFRTTWAPKPLGSGFMALEEWCFAEIERGRPVDEIIRQILDGNECIAILGVATMLALHTDTISETIFPIVTSQRLLSADKIRMAQDLSAGFGNLMGFDHRSDQKHITAVKSANHRAVRKKQLSWLLQRYYVMGGEEFSQRTRDAVLNFETALPFQIEQHRDLVEAQADLSRQAQEYAELVDPQNYQSYRTDTPNEVAIVHVSPSASTPKQAAKAEKAKIYLQASNLWTWASKAFEANQLGDGLTVPKAIDLARKLDSASLFSTSDADDVAIHRGAVAGAAAVALRFREDASSDDLAWARSVLVRAIDAPEERDALWSSSAIIPWHHAIFVARGFASDLQLGSAESTARLDLLRLVAHPLEIVSLTALEEAAKLWRQDNRLVWAAMYLAFTLCHLNPRDDSAPRGPGEPIHSLEDITKALAATTEFLAGEEAWPELPLPPPAWIKMDVSEAKGLLYRPVDKDSDSSADGRQVWAEPAASWYSHYAAKILHFIPVSCILSSPARCSFIAFAASLLKWTIAKNCPPGLDRGHGDRSPSSLFEWTSELGKMLGRLSGLLPLAEAERQFLAPIVAIEDDACWALLHPLADTYINAYIFYAATMPSEAVELIDICLSRFLASPELNPNSYRAGEFSGFDQPMLARALMFVAIERADLAARYVNGDWTTIATIMPIIDRYIRSAGWSASVMRDFLTLCERAKESYPAETFADQVLAVLQSSEGGRRGWRSNSLPARIAGLVQHLSDRQTPLPVQLAQKLLRILDLLIDMGDRRSAALQFCEAFREIQIGEQRTG